MRLHLNAKLVPTERFLLVRRVRQPSHKWLRRYEAEGEAGLQDRTSRPHRIPVQTPRRTLRRIEQLRRPRPAGWETAQELEVPVSTVSKHLKALGLGRIWRLDEEWDPPQRYEHAEPGSLFHVDAKRFGRIGSIGHRIHGNRRKRSRGVGWEVVFVCVDDHTRLAYAEVLPSENGKCATLGSTRQRNTLVEYFCRTTKVQCLPGTPVQSNGDAVQIRLRPIRQISALREVLT